MQNYINMHHCRLNKNDKFKMYITIINHKLIIKNVLNYSQKPIQAPQ